MKKIIALLLAAAMLVPSAAAAKESPEDVSERLYKLYLIENMPETTEKELTRAEAVGYFLSFSGLEAGKDTGSYSFSDVDRKNSAAAAIEQAYMNGLVNGYDDNTFHPDDNLTVAQAAVVFTNILGYKKTANTSDYPYGAMQTASEIGLTKDMSVNPNEDITLGEFFKMMDNAKDTPPLRLDLSNPEKGEYVVDSDKSLLSQKHKIYYDEGIITANEDTSLTEASGRENSVVINGINYELSERCTSEKDMLGCNVEFYYYENRGDRVLLWANPTSKNTILEIDAENIADYNNKTYYYVKDKDSGREYRARVSEYADVIYNGVVDLHPDIFLSGENRYIPNEGSVRLIDNDGDGKYDVIIIESYKTIYTGSVFTDNYTIRDKYTDTEYSFEEDGNKKIEYYKDGKKAAFSDIAPGNILSYTESKTENETVLIRVYISDKTVEGTVSEKYTEDGADYIVIDGTEYKLTSYAKTNAKISVRDSGTFYLDYKGNVAACKAIFKTGLQYGYLMKAYITDGDEERVTLKILTTEGKILFFDMTEKSRLNGEKRTNEDIIDALKYGVHKTTPYAKVVGQPIKYATNIYGEITKLITNINTPGGAAEVLKERIVPYDLDDEGKTYYPGGRNIGMKYGASEDAVVFRVPDINSQLAGKCSDEDFSVEDITTYAHQNGMRFNGFDADEMSCCSLLLRIDMLGSDTIDAKTDSYAMVNSVSNVYDEQKDENVTRLNVLRAGASVNLDINDKVSIIGASSAGEIKKGSVVQYSLLDNGNVGCLKIVTTPDSFTPSDTYDENRTRENVYVRGQVQKKNSSSMIISYEKSGTDYVHSYPASSNKMWFVSVTSAPVYIFDKSTGKVKVTNNISEIKDYEHYGDGASLVMVNLTYMNVISIFAYNE